MWRIFKFSFLSNNFINLSFRTKPWKFSPSFLFLQVCVWLVAALNSTERCWSSVVDGASAAVGYWKQRLMHGVMASALATPWRATAVYGRDRSPVTCERHTSCCHSLRPLPRLSKQFAEACAKVPKKKLGTSFFGRSKRALLCNTKLIDSKNWFFDY